MSGHIDRLQSDKVKICLLKYCEPSSTSRFITMFFITINYRYCYRIFKNVCNSDKPSCMPPQGLVSGE